MAKVEYCGREISKEGLTMSSKKIASVTNFPEPIFARELKSFLGLANYFREFIANHSTIVHPLQALLPDYKRSNRLTWNAEARLAFTAIKEKMTALPCTFLYLIACYIYILMHQILV